MALIVYWNAIDAVYEKWTRPAVAQETADAGSEFWCPMHPTVVRDHPGKCPICGMPLSKRKKRTGEEEALPPGVLSRVQLTPYRVALAGVRTEPVEYRPLTKQIEAAGFVEFDETKLTRITNHISGRSRIDKLYVNVTDQNIAKGDPLALLYSPDLDTTMQNLLDAHRAGNTGLEQMTRERLQLWGIGGDQIDDVVKTGQPITHVTIRSPANGHVLRKYPLEGDYIDEGARLFDVADLSTVWIEAQIFEDDLGFLKKGLVVHAYTEAYPNRDFTGKLTFIHPHLDARTRTLKVRFDLDNPGHVLRPGMYAAVKIDVPATELTASSGRDAGATGGAGRRRPRRPRTARAVGADERFGAGVAGPGRGRTGPAGEGPGAGRPSERGDRHRQPQGRLPRGRAEPVRGRRGRTGAALRRVLPRRQGSGGGRPGGDRRIVPHRRRDAAGRRA